MSGVEFERLPPHDLAAEQCVLGGMLLSKEAVVEVVEVVEAADFYRPAHRIVFEAVIDLFSRGEPVDAISVNAELTKRGEASRVGGAPYLHTLAEAVPTAANAGYYARIVAERAVLRRLVEAGTRIAQIGYSGDVDAATAVEHAHSALSATVTAPEDQRVHSTVGDLARAAMDLLDADAAAALPTGLEGLDRVLGGGLRPGQLAVVAARPAVGKSTLALDVARHAAIHQDRGVLFVSLEMSAGEIGMRLAAAEARVPLAAIRAGEPRAVAAMAEVLGRAETARLGVWDAAGVGVQAIRARAQTLRARGQLDLVVVDYLQLLTSTGRRVENRQQEVAEMSRSLKLLAKELEVPVVALSQLNRAPEQRADKRPQISDLRESGSIEQDADVVILLYREDLYDKESPRAGEADLIVAKHRNGPTATVTAAFQGHYSRFTNLPT